MTNPDGLGAVAAALWGRGGPRLDAASDGELIAGVVDIAAWLDGNGPGADDEHFQKPLAILRVRQVAGADRALVAWLAARPSPHRLRLVARALHQLWAGAEPRLPVDPHAAEELMRIANTLALEEIQSVPLRHALRLAAARVDDRALAARLRTAAS